MWSLESAHCEWSVGGYFLQSNNNCSVTNSSSGLIFVKIRAESGRIFSKNPGNIRAEIRAKLKCCDVVVFLRFRARPERYFAVLQTAQ